MFKFISYAVRYPFFIVGTIVMGILTPFILAMFAIFGLTAAKTPEEYKKRFKSDKKEWLEVFTELRDIKNMK